MFARAVAVYVLTITILFSQINFALGHSETSSTATVSAWPEFDQGKIDEALNNLSPVNKLPGEMFYFLISAKETTQRFFKSTPVERASFDVMLSGKRLKETYLLAKNGEYDKASESLKRYNQSVDNFFKQLAKMEKQKLSNFETLEKLSKNLFYQQRLFAAINQAEDDDESFEENLHLAVEAYTRLLDYAIDKIPTRENELRELLPKVNP